MPEHTDTPRLSERFEIALAWAAKLHWTQLRKGDGDTPYIAHLLSVAALVLEDGGSENETIAALLHDAIEDQGGDRTRQEIRRRFGDTVVGLVDECTETDEEPKPPWRERKEKYIAHIPTLSAGARRIVAADKLHNVRSLIGTYRRERAANRDPLAAFNGGREGTLWFYGECAAALAKAAPGPLADELVRAVAKLERLAKSADCAGSGVKVGAAAL